MHFAPYRRVLALPGVKSVLALSTYGRIPPLAGSMVLTLYVVLELKLGFAAAGAVFSASIFGGALGAPLLGRLTDRYGLRPVVVLGTVTSALFWATAGWMSYPMLLILGFASRVIQVPVFTISRQVLAALVPEEHRRPAYSLDSVMVELSYMTGPSLGVVIATQMSPQAAIWAVGVAVVLSGIGLYLLNPPLRSEAEAGAEAAVRITVRRWLGPGIAAVLLTVGGATFILGATEVVVVAVLKHAGELAWASVVLIAWGVYSMTGGLLYGGLRRAPGPVTMLLLLGLTTTVLAFAGNWLWLLLALIPAGLMCAPTLAGAADAMSRLAPPAVRGEAMGYYGAALSAGMAIGTPLAGVVVDLVGPAWGFVAAGGSGVVMAMAAALVSRTGARAAAVRPVTATPEVAGQLAGAGQVGSGT